MGVPTLKRVRRQSDFLRVRSKGRKIPFKSFIIQYCASPQDREVKHRLGVIASRKVGNAVKRNKGKRIVRELFRIHEPELGPSCDLVIILRANFNRYSFSELQSNYLSACATISKNLGNDKANKEKC